MTITSSTAACDTHTLTFDDGDFSVEVENDDNGNTTIRFSVHGMAQIDPSAWDALKEFVDKAMVA